MPIVYIFLILFLILPLASCAPKELTPVAFHFVEEIPDIPIPEGMEENKDLSVVYDTPEGRIADIYIDADAKNLKTVQDFYAEALPGLGWKKVTMYRYEREQETLEFEMSPNRQDMMLKLTLRPSIEETLEQEKQ